MFLEPLFEIELRADRSSWPGARGGRAYLLGPDVPVVYGRHAQDSRPPNPGVPRRRAGCGKAARRRGCGPRRPGTGARPPAMNTAQTILLTRTHGVWRV